MRESAEGYRWETARGGRIPSGAVPHGYEAGGEPLWVCRVRMHGGVHPAKVRPAFGAAQASWGGTEVAVDEYEVLMDRGVWGIASGGTVPADAFPAGETLDDAARRYAAGFRRVLALPYELMLVVCHEIPVRYAINGANGSSTLDGPVHDIVNAVPYLFDEAGLERAAEGIERLVGAAP